MSSELPPQRRQNPGAGRGAGRNLSPTQAAEEAERRLGRPCYHAGQRVQGLFACVTCQFRIMNRKALPACPDCGELIWAYMQEGPRPVPEGETAPAAPAAATQGPQVEEGVRLEGPQAPVKVEEGVRLEP